MWAAAPYADAVRAALLAHKERGALALAAPLGTALAGAVRAAAAGGAGGGRVRGAEAGGGLRAAGAAGGGGEGVGALPLVLVPVPSARRAVRARGHDAVRRVAVAAARELRGAGVAARVAPVLRQCRAVADQAGLDARRRRENLAGALEVVPGGMRLLEGAGVVLVDDLMTTGASLAEAARALCGAGVASAYGGGGASRGGGGDAGGGGGWRAGGTAEGAVPGWGRPDRADGRRRARPTGSVRGRGFRGAIPAARDIGTYFRPWACGIAVRRAGAFTARCRRCERISQSVRNKPELTRNLKRCRR